jgi:ABC-type transporter Mla subunit MlaD
MATKAQKVKLGFFSLVALVLFAIMAIVFAVSSPFSRHDRYYLVVPDAAGVDLGQGVQIRGVTAGSVKSIDLNEGGASVRVALDIDHAIRLPVGSKAYLELAGVSGLKSINIRGGNPQDGMLAPESTIERGETLIDKLPDQADALMQRVSELFETATRLLAQVSRALEKVDVERINAILASTDKLTKDLAQTSHALNAIVHTSQKPLEQGIQSAAKSFAHIEVVIGLAEQTVRELNQTIVDVQDLVDNNGEDVRATVRKLRGAAEELDTLSQTLRRQPNMLLFSKPAQDRKRK